LYVFFAYRWNIFMAEANKIVGAVIRVACSGGIINQTAKNEAEVG